MKKIFYEYEFSNFVLVADFEGLNYKLYTIKTILVDIIAPFKRLIILSQYNKLLRIQSFTLVSFIIDRVIKVSSRRLQLFFQSVLNSLLYFSGNLFDRDISFLINFIWVSAGVNILQEE